MRKFSGSSKSGAGRCGGRAALGATLKAPPPTQQQKSKYARALRDVCIECIGGVARSRKSHVEQVFS